MNATKAVPKNATFIVVPAGSKPAHCRGQSCGALIYFIRNPKTGSFTPVDCDVEGGQRPSETNDDSQIDMLSGGASSVYDGRGISHFFTCVDADQFTRKGER